MFIERHELHLGTVFLQATDSQLREMYDSTADDDSDNHNNDDDACLHIVQCISHEIRTSRSKLDVHSFCEAESGDDLFDCQIISSLQSMLGPALTASKTEPNHEEAEDPVPPKTSAHEKAQVTARPVATPVRGAVKAEKAVAAGATSETQHGDEEHADAAEKRPLEDAEAAEDGAAKKKHRKALGRQDRPRSIVQLRA